MNAKIAENIDLNMAAVAEFCSSSIARLGGALRAGHSSRQSEL